MFGRVISFAWNSFGDANITAFPGSSAIAHKGYPLSRRNENRNAIKKQSFIAENGCERQRIWKHRPACQLVSDVQLSKPIARTYPPNDPWQDCAAG